LKKNNEAEYITRVEHISEKCRFCDERLELVYSIQNAMDNG